MREQGGGRKQFTKTGDSPFQGATEVTVSPTAFTAPGGAGEHVNAQASSVQVLTIPSVAAINKTIAVNLQIVYVVLISRLYVQ